MYGINALLTIRCQINSNLNLNFYLSLNQIHMPLLSQVMILFDHVFFTPREVKILTQNQEHRRFGFFHSQWSYKNVSDENRWLSTENNFCVIVPSRHAILLFQRNGHLRLCFQHLQVYASQSKVNNKAVGFLATCWFDNWYDICRLKFLKLKLLHYWPTNQCSSFEWNKRRCTYVHLKNLFLVNVVTLLYMDEVRYGLESSLVYIQTQQ